MRKLLLILLSLVGLQSQSLANIVVDQAHEGPGGFATVDYGAQVFTVGIAGKLNFIQVPLRPSDIRSNPLDVADIAFHLFRATSGGVIYGGDLAYQQVRIPDISATPYPLGSSPSLSDFQWITFGDVNLDVVPGERYAVAVQRINTQSFDWVVTFTNQLPYEYAAGGPWVRGSQSSNFEPATTFTDFCFRTLITPVPEPSAFAMCVFGCSSITALRRRK